MMKILNYTLRLARRDPLLIIGVVLVFLFALVAILAPWIAPYPKDISATHYQNRFQPPSRGHIFGTDTLGRDILSRVVYGTRISLKVGASVIVIALLIGSFLGVIAGFFGGMFETVIMRLTDMVLSFPSLLLAMVISAVLGAQLTNSMIAIVISWWPWYTRLLRNEATSVRERDYVMAAEAAGGSKGRIIFKHVLPNCLTPIIVQASMDFGSVIITSASLSFLGLGAQPPTPEWGLMVSIGRTYFLDFWWIVLFPGLAIYIMVISFNLIGDGIRDLLDPKMRRRKGI